MSMQTKDEIPETVSFGGLKHDREKLRYDLIPVHPLRLLAEVYTIGARKYADRNWEKGIAYTRILGAMMRHLEAFRAGESLDPEGGQHHLASVAWGAFALMEYEETHREFDDRPATGQKVYPWPARSDVAAVLTPVEPAVCFICKKPIEPKEWASSLTDDRARPAHTHCWAR